MDRVHEFHLTSTPDTSLMRQRRGARVMSRGVVAKRPSAWTGIGDTGLFLLAMLPFAGASGWYLHASSARTPAAARQAKKIILYIVNKRFVSRIYSFKDSLRADRSPANGG